MPRAALLRDYGRSLEVVDVELAELTPHQVRVRIAASGVCHSDASLQTGAIPFPVPCVPGHEGAGVVEAVGEAVTRVEPGDHVVLCPVLPCRRCDWCTGGQPFLCEQGLADSFVAPYGTVAGETVFAGFTTATFGEVTQVLEGAVVPIGRDVPLEIAALVGCGVTTGVGAVLNTAGVTAGDSVAVVGCGGVGLSAVMGAVVAGAGSIIAVDLSPERLALAETFGATHTVAAGDGDPVQVVRELTGGRGADHVLEVVGKSATIRMAFDMTRRGGACTVVGAGASDDEVRFNAMELFHGGKRLLGCMYGSADPDVDFPRFLDLYAEGRLPLDRLVTDRIGLDQVDAAFAAMAAGEGARSVVVFD